MDQLSRTTALKIAAVIICVMSLIEIIVYDLPDLVRGAGALDQAAATSGGPPFVIVMIGFVVSIIGIVAAYGTWKGQKWGVVLVIIISVLMELNALGGLLFAPSTATRILGGFSIILYLLTILLCLWRDRKPVLA